MTATTANRTVTYGGNFEVYTPKCMRIMVGQSVTFTGAGAETFADHPIEPACGPASAITPYDGGASATFTFNTIGLYGYSCATHEAEGMRGAIMVDP